MHKKTGYMRTTKRISFAAVLCFVLVNIASSATHFSGGENKNQEKGGVKMTPGKSSLTLGNGFHFRGGFTFNTNANKSGKTNLMLNNNQAIRFQKGNNLYVLPYKTRPFYNKFKTPEKPLK